MKLQVTEAHPRDAYTLSIRMEDIIEIDLYGLGNRQVALRDAIAGSIAADRVLAPDGTLVALFGHSAPSPLIVHPWLISAEGLQDYPRDVLLLARKFIKTLRGYYPDACICNWVSKQATSNRAFITHLGFVIEEREGPFDFFYLPQDHVP